MDEPICRGGMETHIENGLVDTVGEGESGTNGESSTNIYTLSHVRRISGKKLLYSKGSPVWCSAMIWRDGMGGEEGGEGGRGGMYKYD